MKTKIFVWYLMSLFLNICTMESVIVKTGSGLVRGKLNHYNNFTYYSFQGIPYAESPTAKLRFQPAIPKKPWNYVLDATREGVVCPQWSMRYKVEQMSEDCLILNIYVPKEANQLLPVLVFLHGGGFVMLSGSSDYIYGPQFFLQRNMIVVTLNFRLGPLGFLSLGIDEASGNAGIKDVILGLKWIKNNIARFGGNRNKITIGGHSSGAALAHYLTLTKQTDGLFQQAILISGSALDQRFLSLHPRDNAVTLARNLGINSNDTHIVLKKLQEVNVFDMLEAFKNMSDMNAHLLKRCNLFLPCVEKKFSHAVITENPVETLEKSGLAQNVPILAGINGQEGIYSSQNLLKNPEGVHKLLNNNELFIPSNIEYPTGSQESKQLGDLITQRYSLNDNDLEWIIVNRLIDYATDIQYVHGVYAWIKLHKSKPDSNTLYFYNFTFDGDLNWAKLNYQIDFPGTAHADELGYIFVTNRTKNLIENADNKSKDMINVIVDLFSNFIKNGIPQNQNTKNWPPFKLNDQKYLLITPNPTVKSLLNSSMDNKQQFWDTVYYQYRQYLENGGVRENKCGKINEQKSNYNSLSRLTVTANMTILPVFNLLKA